MFDGKYINNLGSFWFLWSSLAASITVAVIGKMIKNDLLSIVFMLFGIVIVALFPCSTVLNIFIYPYFIFGFILNKYNKTLVKFNYKKIIYIVPIIYLIMLPFYTKDCYIYTTGLTGGKGIIRHMPVNIYRWMIGMFGSISVITLVFAGMKCNLLNNKFGDTICLLGQKSLQVYTLSVIILSNYLPIIHRKVVSLIGKDIFSQNMIIYNLIFTPLLAIGYSIILLAIIKLLEKTKINYVLFGR